MRRILVALKLLLPLFAAVCLAADPGDRDGGATEAPPLASPTAPTVPTSIRKSGPTTAHGARPSNTRSTVRQSPTTSPRELLPLGHGQRHRARTQRHDHTPREGLRDQWILWRGDADQANSYKLLTFPERGGVYSKRLPPDASEGVLEDLPFDPGERYLLRVSIYWSDDHNGGGYATGPESWETWE